MVKTAIIGGGNLGHVMAVAIRKAGFPVTVYSEHAHLWSPTLTVEFPGGVVIEKEVEVTSDLQGVIADSNHILFALPGQVLLPVLQKIAPSICSDHWVGSVVSSNGFFWKAKSVLGERVQLYGFQRVPFISRIKKYGASAVATGGRPLHKLAILSEGRGEILPFYKQVLKAPLELMGSYLEAALTNSNSILHPSRLSSLAKQQGARPFTSIPLFYEEWDLESSEVLIAADNEFQQLLAQLPIDRKEIPPLLDYYESRNSIELTEKIRSIHAFKGIRAPMIACEGGYRLDSQHRYFVEDIPHGTVILKSLGEILSIETPTIDKMVSWGAELLGKEYYSSAGLPGRDFAESSALQNFQITSRSTLLSW